MLVSGIEIDESSDSGSPIVLVCIILERLQFLIGMFSDSYDTCLSYVFQ